MTFSAGSGQSARRVRRPEREYPPIGLWSCGPKELRAELDLVFTLLAATDERCATDIADGRQLADQATAEAQGQAAIMAARGRERAVAARPAAAGDVLGVASAEAVRLRSAAAAVLPTRPPEADVLTLIELAISFVKSLPPDEPPERDQGARE
jgi:hypothetical protein